MILYHFSTSPFARRVRLALAHKGLSAELRDARAQAEHLAEVRRLNPMHTVPVLVDGDRAIGDSAAILAYLDRKVPAPPLWPTGMDGAEAVELVALADGAIQVLVDMGMRYAPVHDHPRFGEVRDALVGRAQRALDALAARVSSRSRAGAPLFDSGWGAADIAVVTTVMWLDGLAARAATFPLAKKVVELGWSLPPALRAWAQPHLARPDVAALG